MAVPRKSNLQKCLPVEHFCQSDLLGTANHTVFVSCRCNVCSIYSLKIKEQNEGTSILCGVALILCGDFPFLCTGDSEPVQRYSHLRVWYPSWELNILKSYFVVIVSLIASFSVVTWTVDTSDLSLPMTVLTTGHRWLRTIPRLNTRSPTTALQH